MCDLEVSNEHEGKALLNDVDTGSISIFERD